MLLERVIVMLERKQRFVVEEDLCVGEATSRRGPLAVSKAVDVTKSSSTVKEERSAMVATGRPSSMADRSPEVAKELPVGPEPLVVAVVGPLTQ